MASRALTNKQGGCDDKPIWLNLRWAWGSTIINAVLTLYLCNKGLSICEVNDEDDGGIVRTKGSHSRSSRRILTASIWSFGDLHKTWMLPSSNHNNHDNHNNNNNNNKTQLDLLWKEHHHRLVSVIVFIIYIASWLPPWLPTPFMAMETALRGA